MYWVRLSKTPWVYWKRAKLHGNPGDHSHWTRAIAQLHLKESSKANRVKSGVQRLPESLTRLIIPTNFDWWEPDFIWGIRIILAVRIFWVVQFKVRTIWVFQVVRTIRTAQKLPWITVNGLQRMTIDRMRLLAIITELFTRIYKNLAKSGS